MISLDKLVNVGQAGWNIGLDLLFPKMCVGCSSEGKWICAKCRDVCADVDMIPHQYGKFPFDSLTAVYSMDGPARDAVHALKYHDLRAIAPDMGNMMANRLNGRYELDVIIPMPLHGSRLRHRGYNQAHLLAKVISKRLNVPLGGRKFKRVINTAPLANSKSLEERKNAIENAFECREDLGEQRVLLVDDVVTSGNTMGAAANELKMAGAKFVHATAFAMEM